MQDRPTSVVLIGGEEVPEYFLLGEMVEENPQHLMVSVISGYIRRTKELVKTRELDRERPDDLVVSMIGSKHPGWPLVRTTCTR